MSDSADFASLRDQIEGKVVLSGDDGWDGARLGFNLAADQQPAAVAVPASTADVVTVVRFAKDSGLRVAAQGPGHGAPALGDLAGSILLRTHELNEVSVDAEAKSAKAGAGAPWGPVVAACAEHGLVPLAGSSPTVGVGGYTLGGGIGFLGRKHGIQANKVTAIEAVLADGSEVRASAETETDLFWALRGGGGAFAVVTALEFDLIEMAEFAAGALAWPWERSEEVLQAWLSWTKDAPEEISSGARLMQFPPLETVPEPLRGRQMVMIDAVWCGDPADAEAVMAPLRELGPELDTWAVHPAAGLAAVHGDPTDPMPAISSHVLFDDLSSEAISAWLDVAGPGSGSPLIFSEIRHWGGAIAREPDGAGAIGCFKEQYSLFNLGIAMGPEITQAGQAHGQKIIDALSEWRGERVYTSFYEEPSGSDIGFSSEAYGRLQEVKRAVDPDDLFQSNHPVAP